MFVVVVVVVVVVVSFDSPACTLHLSSTYLQGFVSFVMGEAVYIPTELKINNHLKQTKQNISGE